MKRWFFLALLGCTHAKEPSTALPEAERLFAVPLTAQGPDALLGAVRGDLWAADVVHGVVTERFRVHGEGTAQFVAAGDVGQGWRIYAVWGRGRGALGAPLVLREIDPQTGATRELFRYQGERTDAAYLAVTDVDNDGKPDVAFAYFESKYMVRAHHLTQKGVVESPALRMAMARAYADVDGDGAVDEIVGRPYGDTQTAPGDLRVILAHGETVFIPTDRGVRGLTVGTLPGEAHPSIYFADGWTAAYAKEAKAQAKRAHWDGGKFIVESVGASADEYSFDALELADLDGDAHPELVAQGNKRTSVFAPGTAGWTRREVKPLAEPGATLAHLRDGWTAVFALEQRTKFVRL